MNRMLRMTATALAVTAAFSVTASAQSRPDARTMSCHEVQSMIGYYGAVVLTTGRHTYDRYVAHRGYCSHPYEPRPVSISARDGQCTVYRCAEPLFEPFRRHWD